MSVFNVSVLIDSAAVILLQLLFAATVLLLGCHILTRFAGRWSAAVKHRIWSLGLVGLIPFLFLVPLLPQVGVRGWSLSTAEPVPQHSTVATTTVPDRVDLLDRPDPSVSDRTDLAIDAEQRLLARQNRPGSAETTRVDFGQTV
jgi:hypothetical protein